MKKTNIDVLRGLLNIRQAESSLVILLLAYSFTISLGLYIYYTAATTIFLTRFDSSMLPIAYIAGGLFVHFVGRGNFIIQKYVKFSSLAICLVISLIISLSLLLISYKLTDSKWTVFLIFLWIRANLFVFSFTFWLSASRLFDLSQAKRLYSLIGTGEVLASIVANFLVKTLISEKILKVDSLLYIALLFITISLFFIIIIVKRNKEKLSFKKITTNNINSNSPALSKNYPLLMYLLGLIPIACLYIIEFSFSVDSKINFPDKEQLAIFLGQFLLICSIIEFLVKGILFQFVTKTYGIMSGLILLPISLIVISALLFLMTALSIKVFFLILISRFLITSVRRSFSDTSYQLLYQPIPKNESIKLQNQVEIYAKPIGYIAAGSILFILTKLGFSNTVSIFLFLLVFLIIWAVLAFVMQKEYKLTLLNILSVTSIISNKVNINNLKSLIYTEKIYDKNLSLEKIIKLAESPDSIEREEAAHMLGESGRYFAFKYIIKLLDDKVTSVKLAAILAAPKISRVELIPFLVPGILVPELKLATKQTLCKIGEPIINYLNIYFNKYSNEVDTIDELIDTLEVIGGPKVIRYLRSKLTHPSDSVTDRVMESLIRMGYTPNLGEVTYLITQIDIKVNTYLWLLSAENDLKDTEVNDNLSQSLRDERKSTMLKLLTIFSFLRGDSQFYKVKELIYGTNTQSRTYLADLVNLLIDSEEIKARVLTLFENISDYEILLKYQDRYPQQSLLLEHRLVCIVNKDNLTVWTKALALKEILNYSNNKAIDVLAANATTQNILLAETALFGLINRNPSRFEEISCYFKDKNDNKYKDLCNKVRLFKDKNDLTISKSNDLSIFNVMAE